MHPRTPLHFIFLLGLLLLLPRPAAALEFRVLSWSGPIDDVFLKAGSKRIAIHAVQDRLSPVLQVSPPLLVLYREVVVEGKPKPVAVASITVPQGLSRAILMLAQDPADPNQITGLWLDDAKGATDSGAFVFHNLSRLPVAVKVENVSHVIVSRETWTQGFAKDANSSSVSIVIPDGAKPRYILNSPLKVHPDYRILFIFWDGRRSKIDPDDICIPVQFVMIYDYEPKPVNKG